MLVLNYANSKGLRIAEYNPHTPALSEQTSRRGYEINFMKIQLPTRTYAYKRINPILTSHALAIQVPEVGLPVQTNTAMYPIIANFFFWSTKVNANKISNLLLE